MGNPQWIPKEKGKKKIGWKLLFSIRKENQSR
jgi:hypothetical protein